MWSLAQVITGGVTEITTIVLATDGPLTQSPILQVAVYEVVTAGLTVIEVPVAPVDHVTVPVQPVAVNVALSPTQMESELHVTTGGVTVITVTVLTAELGLKHSPT